MSAYRTYRRKRGSLGNASITTLLILANVIIFFIFSIWFISNQDFVNFIAIKPSNILQGQYLWTIFTSMFMHGGVFHLFANMFSLFFIGSLVERIIGPRRYILFYLLSGIFASILFVLLSLIFKSDFNTFAVGASGALFGLIGFLMLITPNLPVFVMFIPIPIKMKYAAPGILIVLWLVSVAGNIPIGNTAHLGGLVAGIIYALYIRKKYKNKIRMIGRHFS